MIRIRLLTVSVVAVSLCRPVAAAEPEELVRAAIQGYRQHWDKFDFLTVRYLMYGAAEPPKTYDEAIGLRWKRTKVITCSLAVDGDGWVFRMDGDDPPFDPKKLVHDKDSPALLSGPAPVTRRYIGNGTESMDYIPQHHAAGLFEAGARIRSGRPDTSPLHLLGYHNPVLNPYDLLLAAERDRKPWTAGGPTEINGSQCVSASFRTPNQMRTVFHLDLRHGYLPVRIQEFANDKNGKEYEVTRTEVIELRHCSRDRWFPMKVRTVELPGLFRKTYSAYVKDVTDLDVDHRPTKDQLVVEMPAGTRFIRQSKRQSKYVVHLRKGERIGPGDLHRIVEISEARQANPLTDTAIQPARRRSWWWYGLPAAGLVSVGGGLVWYRWRVRRQS